MVELRAVSAADHLNFLSALLSTKVSKDLLYHCVLIGISTANVTSVLSKEAPQQFTALKTQVEQFFKNRESFEALMQRALEHNHPDSLRTLWTLYTSNPTQDAVREVYLTLTEAKIAELTKTMV